MCWEMRGTIAMIGFDQGEKRGSGNRPFLHCQNCDSLAVVVVAHFHPHLTGRHLAAIGRPDDCFCRLQLGLS